MRQNARHEPARRTDRGGRDDAGRPVGTRLDRCPGRLLHRQARSGHGRHRAIAGRRESPRRRQHRARGRAGQRGTGARPRDCRGPRVGQPRADRGGPGAVGGSAALRRHVEPLRAVEAGKLLNRAVDRLGDLRAVNDDAAGAVRKLVLSLLLAVARVTVDGRLAKTSSWKPKRAEPKVLDLSLASFMVSKEVASQAKPLAADVKKLPDELDKESGHRWV